MLTESKELVALMPVSELSVLIQHIEYDTAKLPDICERLGLPRETFVEASGYLDPVVAWHLLAIIANDLNDECLGVLSSRVPVGCFELMLAKALHEPTIGRAISAFADAGTLLWPEVELKLIRRLDELHFCMKCHSEDIPQKIVQMLLEISCVTFFCMFQWLSDTEISVKRIRISKERLSAEINQLAALNCPVQFEGKGVDIVLSGEMYDVPTAARNTAGWFNETYQILLAVLQKRALHLRSSDLRASVLTALRRGVNQQSLIAASLGMSVATLRRRLAHEGLSFTDLRDSVFREVASSLISSGESVEHIAAQMGYSEARSFRRAFRRVFDSSPSEQRHLSAEQQRGAHQ